MEEENKKLIEENNILKNNLDLLQSILSEVANQRNNALNDLAYVKAELIKIQKDK